ncbi:hypothetical protein J437_LFUL016699 [Ladona fulva]|uniref:Uncharacterized protein n=1 Tax=Ladona fulva TaxID=123851 RepID=A0A8K0PBI1_LADFU|nr:hypothetical protein J437_LFUL016699 [Ladona fulva]
MKPWCGTLEEGDEASQEETDAAGADSLAEADNPGEPDRENCELGDKEDLQRGVGQGSTKGGPRTALLSGKADCGTRDEQNGRRTLPPTQDL